jgi:hypothetical protein
MRSLPWICCMAISASAFLSNAARADGEVDPALRAARIEARRQLQCAIMESDLYWQVEYPRQRRAINADIEMTERVIKANKALLREYYPFNRFETGSALYLPSQDLRLCIRGDELRLEDLRQDRNNLIRYHADRLILLEQNVQAARERLVELEGGGEIELEVRQ